MVFGARIWARQIWSSVPEKILQSAVQTGCSLGQKDHPVKSYDQISLL